MNQAVEDKDGDGGEAYLKIVMEKARQYDVIISFIRETKAEPDDLGFIGIPSDLFLDIGPEMENKPKQLKQIIVAGNPVDGLQFYGPYDSAMVAATTGNKDGNMPEEWWIAPLHPGS
jgi:hypothetical protein